MLEFSWRLPTAVVLLLSLPLETATEGVFLRTRERARAIREEIVAGWIYFLRCFFFKLNVVLFLRMCFQ